MNALSLLLRAAPPAVILLVGACATSSTRGEWIDLFNGRNLAGWRSSEFGGDGEVRVEGGVLILEQGSPLTGVTWCGAPPSGCYELEVTARRVAGDDFFCGLTFPVGGHFLTLILGGWGGSVCGLSSLDGADASGNETCRMRHFENGVDYTARVRVTPERMDVWLDGKPFFFADLTGRFLDIRPEVILSRPLGIAAYACQSAVRRLRWRPLP